MRVTLVVHRFPVTSETFIASKYLRLRSRREVTVACENRQPGDWKHFAHLDGAARRAVRRAWPTMPRWRAAAGVLPALAAAAFHNPRGTWRYLRNGWRETGWRVGRHFYRDAHLIASRPDLLHYEFGPIARVRPRTAAWLGCKSVVSFRGYDLNYAGLEDPNYYRRVWPSVDGVHCLGGDLWKRALSRGCPESKEHALIPPAIDAAFFTPQAPRDRGALGSEERPLRVLSVGRLEWKKGYEFAMETIARLRAMGRCVEYAIAGNGAYFPALAFCRAQLGLDDAVTFLGAVDRAGVRERMQWADVFLHAAVSEGFCNAVLEAQAMRLPVVTSDADGLAENVQDGVTGFVTPRREAGLMAARLSELAADGDLRERMGDAGRRRVAESFHLAGQLAAFEAFYDRVMG